jgi:hydroxypyruvate reductase
MPMAGAKNVIHELFDAALAAVEPAAAVRSHLACRDGEVVVDDQVVPLAGRLLVVGAGKASIAMARGVEAVCGDMIDDGIVITTDGHERDEQPEKIAVRAARHPIPDQRGVEATRELLRLVNDAKAGDVVLAIISGGGSALLEAPKPPVTLEEMGRTTDLLLRAGAPIQDLNAVRTPLSEVKGGGLRRAAGDATVVTLILSDVLGNDPRVIASGPTVPGAASGAMALAILDQFGVTGETPRSVLDLLRSDAVDAPTTPSAQHDILAIIADNDSAVRAAEQAALRRGLTARVVWSERTGEASELGRAWVRACLEAPERVRVLLGGGEATVTVRGDGIGGRNTEFALAAAEELDRLHLSEWTVASLATDGVDGMADAAGAIADAGTISRVREQDIDPHAALADNDSATVFAKAGGLVKTGPTGTNVNDVYIAVRQANR